MELPSSHCLQCSTYYVLGECKQLACRVGRTPKPPRAIADDAPAAASLDLQFRRLVLRISRFSFRSFVDMVIVGPTPCYGDLT